MIQRPCGFTIHCIAQNDNVETMFFPRRPWPLSMIVALHYPYLLSPSTVPCHIPQQCPSHSLSCLWFKSLSKELVRWGFSTTGWLILLHQIMLIKHADPQRDATQGKNTSCLHNAFQTSHSDEASHVPSHRHTVSHVTISNTQINPMSALMQCSHMYIGKVIDCSF